MGPKMPICMCTCTNNEKVSHIRTKERMCELPLNVTYLIEKQIVGHNNVMSLNYINLGLYI